VRPVACCGIFVCLAASLALSATQDDNPFKEKKGKKAEVNPFKEKDDNPFKEKGKGDDENPFKDKEGAPKKAGGAQTFTTPKREEAALCDVTVDDNKGMKPDTVDLFELASKPIPLRAWRKLKTVAGAEFAIRGDAAYVFFKAPGDRSTFFERVDLSRGVATGSWPIVPGSQIVAVSPSNNRVAILTGEGLWKKTIEVWEIGPKPGRLLMFRPHGEETFQTTDWAEFTDEDTLLTRGGQHEFEIIAWKLPECKALWRLPVEMGDRSGFPVLSPGRKQMAIGVKNEIAVVDIAAGKAVARIPLRNDGFPTFSQSGKKLACVSQGFLSIWDFTQDKLLAEIHLGEVASSRSPPQWVTDDLVLLAGRLYSAKRETAVWTYEPPAEGTHYLPADGKMWYFNTRGRGKELSVELLPFPAFTEKQKQAIKSFDPSEQLWRFGKGMTASVVVRVDGGDATAGEVRKIITDRLEKMGVKVGEGGPLSILASIAPGSAETVKYGKSPFSGFGASFGHDRGVETQKTFVPHLHKLTISGKDGEKIYEATMRTSAPFLLVGDDQSKDKQFKDHQKPNPKWFDDVRLPRVLTPPKLADGLGTTKLGARAGG